MGSLTAGEVRTYLDQIDTQQPPPDTPGLLEELRSKGALAGSAGTPSITPVGRHVLRELRVRAYRVDALPLLDVSEELSSTLAEIDGYAHHAEIFLGDVGPLAPSSALPYMRVSSAALSTRGDAPEELAEQFRNVWGMVEVMAGSGGDRLLATEMLMAAGVPVSRLYSSIVPTLESLRRSGRVPAEPVSTATALHLFPSPTPVAQVARWERWRSTVRSELAAAVLAGTEVEPPTWEACRGRWLAAGASSPEAEHAATYLVAVPGGLEALPRAIELAGRLSGRLPTPCIAAALLAARHGLSAEELADWVEKAAPIVGARRLAPTEPERLAVAVALVQGLAPTRFRGLPTPAHRPITPPGADALALLALHAWTYRPFVLSGVPA